MAYNLRNRSFLAIKDFNQSEIKFLLKLSADLKSAICQYEQKRLNGKNIVLIFEKDSTRTKIGFEVIVYELEEQMLLFLDQQVLI